jgi:hypothetical protein
MEGSFSREDSSSMWRSLMKFKMGEAHEKNLERRR